MSIVRVAAARPSPAALAVTAVVVTVLGLAACGDSSSASSPTVSCATYCAQLTANCSATADVQFADEAACTTYCTRARTDPAFWSLGVEGAASGNSLACRVWHGSLAAGAGATVHCPHAGPSGGNVCGGWCEDYCDLALAVCTGGLQLYPDRATCLAACAPITSVPATPNATSGDSIQCRINHLGRASAGGAAATTHCPHAQATPAAGTPCTTP